MDQALINFILATLDDNKGISGDALDALRALQSTDKATSEAIEDILNQVDGCEGRYYLPDPVIDQYRNEL